MVKLCFITIYRGAMSFYRTAIISLVNWRYTRSTEFSFICLPLKNLINPYFTNFPFVNGVNRHLTRIITATAGIGDKTKFYHSLSLVYQVTGTVISSAQDNFFNFSEVAKISIKFKIGSKVMRVEPRHLHIGNSISKRFFLIFYSIDIERSFWPVKWIQIFHTWWNCGNERAAKLCLLQFMQTEDQRRRLL